MWQRSSSSLGFNNVAGTYGIPPQRSPMGIGSGEVASSGVMLAAELYNSLAQLENLGDNYIPPPPYEPIAPGSNLAAPHLPSINTTINSHDHYRHQNNTNHVLRTTPSTSSSNSSTAPVLPIDIPGLGGVGAHHHQRTPHEHRPLLTFRSRSEATVCTTSVGRHHPSTPAHIHSPTQAQRTASHHAQQKSPQKLVKYRPLPPHIIHQHKVNQVYQSPHLGHRVSASESLTHSRPPLSNASRTPRILRKPINGRQSSSHFRAGSGGSSTQLPGSITAVVYTLPSPSIDQSEHNVDHRARRAPQPPPKSAPEPAAQGGRPATPIGPSAPQPYSPTGQTTLTHFVCHECPFRFYNEQLMQLHYHLSHKPRSHPANPSSAPYLPHPPRAPPPVPLTEPSANHIPSRPPARGSQRSRYFT
ncbi:hypothetical protein PCANC_16529 [Puccinia coronata f. sp. avenae]|uniref:C2H2-type domain-containing protein n=1 Tax=Puccinia coronata f. sp. avenae TaxID=200324 RepID=A0A2N5U8L2_9BASI|nr:hypothetical protein PCASD_19542 [Puccinia coronata f. sp. avenae]PLW34075.1 hypothetical protein PCASD_13082 [Puccinia coronata f. sp. avenae]PLW38585.1 hypothetical protein PCANC_16529 [Puccinia coronata f. sp. avenae]